MKTGTLILMVILVQGASAQQEGAVTLSTSDSQLQETFDWAKRTALGYAHDGNDPVGYWYEAALPGREAFCMRDVSHQSIGGETLGLSRQNFNMMYKFATNISESKDWCTYWEINRYDKPAPVDYADDEHFWYNLPSNADIINACFGLYNWTGNPAYLSNPVLDNFYEKSLTVYLDRWKLNPQELASRPRYMNTEFPFKQDAKFNGARGIPSYVESTGGFTCGIDLVAALYAGCQAYGEMLSLRGETQKAEMFLDKALAYKTIINDKWWNAKENRFETSLMPGGQFRDNDAAGIYGETYILWFRAVSDASRAKAILGRLIQGASNMENRSHYPWLLYRFHVPEEAYPILVSLKDMRRSEYPEVSFGAMEGIVAGLMGVRPSAAKYIVQTLPQLTAATEWAQLKALPVLNTTINIRHVRAGKSELANNGASAVKWQACFYGNHKTINVDGKDRDAGFATDEVDNGYSFVVIEVSPNSTVTASIS
jgi:hypothetical protein